MAGEPAGGHSGDELDAEEGWSPTRGGAARANLLIQHHAGTPKVSGASEVADLGEPSDHDGKIRDVRE